MSYNGRLDFGIVACPKLVPDVESIATYLGDALAELRPAEAELAGSRVSVRGVVVE